MNEHEGEATCLNCGWRGGMSNMFCPHCGLLLGKSIECCHHPHREAKGICVICLRPYCAECGGRKGGVFLCSIHAVHEIRDETALVYETESVERAHLMEDVLRQSGLHPRESEAVETVSERGPLPYYGTVHLEVQIYVPFGEVEKAEDLVASITEET